MTEFRAPYPAPVVKVAVTPTVPSDNGSGRVPNGKPPRLQGVVIATNSATVRRRVYEAYWRWPLLPVESAPLVVALFDNTDRRRKLARARDALEARVKAKTQPENRHLAVLTADEGVRQVEEEIRHKDTVILRQLDALGWTPTAMARLGIDLGRLQDRLSQDGVGELPEDVTELEGRIIERLQHGGGGSSPSSAPASTEGDDG